MESGSKNCRSRKDFQCLVKSLLCYNKNSVKKILSYILIALILSTNLFAPFSVGMDSNTKVVIQENIASADNCIFDTNKTITINPKNNPDTGVVTITINVTKGCLTSTGTHNVWVELYNQQTTPDIKVTGFLIDTITGTTITADLARGEYGCSDSKSCDIYVRGYTEATVTGVGVVTNSSDEYSSEDKSMYSYTCATAASCNQSITWKDATSSGPIDTVKEADKATADFNAAQAAADKACAAANAETDPTKQAQLQIICDQAQADLNKLASARSLATNFDYKTAKAAADKICAAANTETDPTIKTQLLVQCAQATSIADAKLNKVITGGGVGPSRQTNQSNSIMPACSILGVGSGTFMGCIAQGFYYVLFVPTSYLFALSGVFFDSTFAYSVQDTSYKSAFVVQGWGIVRDFCNMLFIFIMLYVAIGTILSLHSMKTKETIVNIVIIGLFINFSLFATQVIIDSSNIMARVFYNSNKITLTKKGVDSAATAFTSAGGDGVIPLSEALINKVNPQNLIIRSGEINNISNNQLNNGIDSNSGSDGTNLGPGQFILIVLMASGVNIVGFTVFITVGFLFIARVIGLWLAMILSPLAFFTYILPEMAGTKMIGWKNWWPDTLKMAFLAPVFIFFMYLILKFLEADLISDASGKYGLAFFVATLIPFAFIMILLIKAKKIATDMSGEFGEMAVKAGSAVGGMALGGAVGAGAFAMRGTIGALGDKVANSDWAKTHGRLGNMVADAGKWTSSRSFDVRSTKLGGNAMKGMGVDTGKGKEGGYAKHKSEIIEKRRARAESHKLGNNSKEVQQLHTSEEDLSNLKNTAKNDTDRIDGTLAAKRLVAGDASQKLASANAKLVRSEKDAENLEKDPNATQEDKNAAKDTLENARIEAKAAQDYFDTNSKTIADLTKERTELNSGTGRHWDKTSDGRVDEETFSNFKTEAANKETTFNSKSASLDADIKTAKDKVESGITAAESELNKLKQTLANETAIANPASPQDMALLQKTKDEVTAAENKFNTLNISKSAAIESAEKEIRDTLETANTENTTAQKTLSAMQKAVSTYGTSKKGIDDRSLDGLSLRIIPHEHHHVEEENAKRVNEYAKTIRSRWFNKDANDVAAHEAIMRSEIKKH